MEERSQRARKLIAAAVPYVLFAVVLFLTLSLKVDYHMDEVWSYGLANHPGDIVMDFELGKTYDPKEVYDDYLVVGEDHRFDYANVWENQRNDNHPPLYYALLHTICSLFPGTFSKWYAGAINIFFALLMFVFARRLIRRLTHSETVLFALSVALALSAGVLNVASFLRMYLPAMCWCTILASLALDILARARERARSEEKTSSLEAWPQYVAYALVSALAALTHYYCVVFIVLLTVSLLIALLCYRQWVHSELLLASVLTGALAAYLVFSDMVRQVFAGERGTESMENLADAFGYPQRLKYFFSVFDRQLFGGFLVPILVLTALLIAAVLFLRVKVDYVPYAVLTVPVLGYFFLIAKVAVYETDRYMFPIFVLVFLLVCCLLTELARALLEGFEHRSERFTKRVASWALAGVLALCLLVPTASGHRKADWEYLYRSHVPYLEQAAEYRDYDCLCIYHARYQVPTFYHEMMNYKSVTFLWDGKVEGIRDLDIADSDHVLVKVISDENDGSYLKKAQKQFPQFRDAKDLYTFWAGTTTELL